MIQHDKLCLLSVVLQQQFKPWVQSNLGFSSSSFFRVGFLFLLFCWNVIRCKSLSQLSVKFYSGWLKHGEYYLSASWCRCLFLGEMYQVVMLVIWAFISFPLALLGTIVGRNWSGVPDNPCRVKTIPRPIPKKQWYLTPPVITLLGGLLPFGSIFIEMYFVFTSFWNYKVKP